MAVLSKASRIAETNATVLIEGESGTGKDLFAHLIHAHSPRAEHPLITVNCAAMPRELLESELFGHVKGSFTGAHASVAGRVELAHKGTLFLDEIGELPLELQAKLLRFVQHREIEKIGSRLPLKVDVRLIAATNRDLRAMATEGRFREDLYYRLAVVPFNIPPLRERLEDIPLLVRHLFQKQCVQYKRTNLTLPEQLLPCFSTHTWPGNVRELENVIESIVILAPGDVVHEWDLPVFLRNTNGHSARQAFALPESGIDLEQVERDFLRQALERTRGNQSPAATLLSITRRALRYRMEKHGIPRTRRRTPNRESRSVESWPLPDRRPSMPE